MMGQLAGILALGLIQARHLRDRRASRSATGIAAGLRRARS